MGSSSTDRGRQRQRPRHRRRSPGRARWLFTAAALVLLGGIGGTAAVVYQPVGERQQMGAGTNRSSAASTTASPGGLFAPPATRAAEAPGPLASPTVCRYAPAPTAATGGDDRPPPARPAVKPTHTGTVRAILHTNRGPITIELYPDRAPCTVNAFVSLAAAGFFADTACHRLTTAAIFVLQCGDPTATGAGGPGYRFDDENLPVGVEPAYPRGTLAMANAGPDTNGSQFFMVYRDSAIDPNFPVFGRVVSGLDLIDTVAAGGAPNGDGTPNVELNLEKVELPR